MSHYEMKTHENPVNIFMVYSQVFHMFFMAFSWINSPGFSWVRYHEKAMKKPLICHENPLNMAHFMAHENSYHVVKPMK